MQILDAKRPLLLWGAERPFQLQLLAGLGRLGMDVFALTNGPEGKKLIDQIHPKNSEKLEVPENFEGQLIWAPSDELFSNSTLSRASMDELQTLLKIVAENVRIEKCFFFLPQSSYSEFSELIVDNNKAHALFFPPLLSFGDKNILDGILNQLLDSGIRATPVEGDFLSVFDAISMSLGLIQQKEKQTKLWAVGQPLMKKSIIDGFAEAPQAGLLGSMQNIISKVLGEKNNYLFEHSTKPAGVIEALEVFPTVLTPWERFFRDSYRIYLQTEDSGLLLHFRPTKSP